MDMINLYNDLVLYPGFQARRTALQIIERVLKRWRYGS
jgi:hypothetical protein